VGSRSNALKGAAGKFLEADDSADRTAVGPSWASMYYHPYSRPGASFAGRLLCWHLAIIASAVSTGRPATSCCMRSRPPDPRLLAESAPECRTAAIDARE
jgi:hypothetical protein